MSDNVLDIESKKYEVEKILELAESLGYSMTTTNSNTKAEIIADFLVQQG